MNKPTNTAVAPPEVNDIDRLSMMLFFAAIIHAVIILGLNFDFFDEAKLKAPPALEVILVQKQSAEDPDEADYLAQLSQDGGGNSEDKNRPSEAFTANTITPDIGIAPIMPEVFKQEKAPIQNDIVTQLLSEREVVSKPKPDDKDRASELEKKLQELELKIAQQASELNLTTEKYAKLPKVLQLTARTKAYVPAKYLANWVNSVERVGNLNYPKSARLAKLEGSLLLQVEIKHTGEVLNIKVLRSSGQSILDEAAQKTVSLAAPYPKFDPELREIADHIQIVRTWVFKKGDLNTK